jgi:alpha,alpha-trehalose-phosphate synthase [UDP-forming]
VTRAEIPMRSRRCRFPSTRASGWERRFAPLDPYDGRNRRRGAGRLFLASNRLPVTLLPRGTGGWDATPASGGLVTALDPILSRRGGVWTGWPGAPRTGQAELDEALTRRRHSGSYQLQAVSLSAEEVESYYGGFANQVLWPLLHGFTHHCRPEPGFWESYVRVNRRFAASLAAAARWDDLIWIQDYHLMTAGREFRALGMEHRLAFFLHTPFPRFEVLRRIPWHRDLVEALLHFDLLGFQTTRDQENFLDSAQRLVPGAFSAGRADTVPILEGRRILTGTFPISIDYEAFAVGANGSVVSALEREIRGRLGRRTLLLGVDRLDYTKGIQEKLRGLDLALEGTPELRGSLLLKQLVVPSRETVPAYRETREEIEELVSTVNRRWRTDGWEPIQYRYGTWSRSELLAHYRAADAALITPLTDGMNLVAKEFVAANDGSGVLVLSAFAGAAAELGPSALLVDPTDPESVAAAIVQAHSMAPGERQERMARASGVIRAHDVHGWVDAFLEAGIRAG